MRINYRLSFDTFSEKIAQCITLKLLPFYYLKKNRMHKHVYSFFFRALWYDPVYYPASWQLDPTEGPNRERRRLQRCYLTIPNKYLLPDRQKQEGNYNVFQEHTSIVMTTSALSFVGFFIGMIKTPLCYLFEDKTHSSHSSTVKDKAASEHIRQGLSNAYLSFLPSTIPMKQFPLPFCLNKN